MLISFVIIGKNEESNIENCIKSIIYYIDHNKLLDSQIIFVDSDSTDNSIDLVKKFNNVEIYKIYGNINAAVARNVGAKISKGNILFFIDADMEIDPFFYKSAFNNNKLIYPFISGNYISKFYKNNNVCYEELYYKYKENVFETTTGGIFLIERDLWFSNDGMKNKYRRSQDLDFGLRLSKKGTKLLRLNKVIAIHHTISYYDTNRLWKDLFNNNQLYQKSVLYRDHITNKYIYKYIFREITLLILIISLFLSIFFNIKFIILYIFFIFLKCIYKKNNGVSKNFIIRLTYYFLLDIYTFIGLLIFWPNNKKIFQIQKIS